MKLNITIFLSILYLILLTSCEKHTQILNNLSTIDKLMDTHPDSALVLLQQMDTKKDFNKKEKAYYSLFLTKALFKNYIPISSDSLINISTEYFASIENDPINKAYNYFYRGQINAGQDKPQEAWEDYRYAAEIAEETTDLRLKELIYNHWGLLCLHQDLIEEALEKLNKSLSLAELNKDLRGKVHVLRDLSTVYQYIAKRDSALHYAFLMLETSKIANQKDLLPDVYQHLASLYRELNRIEEGMEYINKSIELENDSNYLITKYIQKAELFFLNQQYDSCYAYYNIAFELDTTDIHYKAIFADAFSRMEEKRGNYSAALDYRNNYMEYIYIIRKSNFGKELSELQKKYDLTIIQNENVQLKVAKKIRENLILYITITSIFIIGSIILYRNKQLKSKNEQIHLNKMLFQQEQIKILEQQKQLLNKERELSFTIQAHNNLTEQLKEFNEKNEKEKNRLKKEHKEILNNYIQSEKDLKEKLLKSEEIIKKIDALKYLSITQKIKQNKKLILSPKELEELQFTIDNYYNKFTKRLKDKYPRLTPRDIHICCLIKANVSSKDIPILLGIEEGTLTRHKYRIKKERMILEENQTLEDIIISI